MARVVSCILGSRGYWLEPVAGEQWISLLRNKGFTSLFPGTRQHSIYLSHLKTSFHLSGSPDAQPLAIIWLGYSALSAELSMSWSKDCHPCQDGTSHQRANPVTWADMQVRQVPLCGTEKSLGVSLGALQTYNLMLVLKDKHQNHHLSFFWKKVWWERKELFLVFTCNKHASLGVVYCR